MPPALIGLNVSTAATPGADPVAAARRAEELGFDLVSASDHLHGRQPTFEPWTMLSWVAAATSRVLVATRVLGVPYRHPAVVAKMAESFDRLSGGRLVLGLGGGAVDEEFRAFGLGVRSPRDKVDGLEEAIRIARGMWSRPAFSFEGRLYHADGAELEPKPAHRIPIWLGTYGDRALALTGRLADGWIPSLAYAPPERVTELRRRVLAAAAAAGRDPATVTCAYNVGVRVDERAGAGPSAVVGAPDAVTERLLGFLRLGFTALNLIPVGPGEPEQVERLAREVVPALRAA
jgi:alkanesulfonate monooxygenase SsuD/methylene tetrahydromethanopterin reductase-like flavin-dependent oxidoreductase (luciferase family)